MVVVDKKLIDGKKVAYLDADCGSWIDDCLEKAVTIASNGKYDECRFSINGVHFTIDHNATFEQLREIYNVEMHNVKTW